MEKEKSFLTCADVRSMDMVDYLNRLGYQPQKISRADYWYLSPLREERTASFKVARKLNVWYDHGIGKGGTLIDFCLLYFNCPLREVLQRLSGAVSFHPQQPFIQKEVGPKEEEILIRVTKEQTLSSLVLQRYLVSRNITLHHGQALCCEVSFLLHEKGYNGIGFKNRSGGYEIRNSWFKGSTAPKDISLIQNGGKELAVFEGFFDLLSYQRIVEKPAREQPDFLVLNSASFFDRSASLFPSYRSIQLYFDQDKTGWALTQKALSLHPNCSDGSHLYQGYKDLNDWHCHIGKKQKQGNQLSLK